MSKSPPFVPHVERRVVAVAFDDHQPLDIVGPMQVFNLANREGIQPLYEVRVVAEVPGRVRVAAGPDIVVDDDLSLLQLADTVIVPGGPGVGSAAQSMALRRALNASRGRARRICSVCTGAFVLASAGLLAGRRATTHWEKCGELARLHRDVEVLTSPIYVNDGDVWTSAGVTAGIDMALALVEQDHGHVIAARIARKLVVYLRRPGGQPQSSEMLAMQERAGNGLYLELMNRVASTLYRPWSIEELADAVGQTPRTFQRRFREAMGCSAFVAVQDLRLARARLLLETTDALTATISNKCGFASEEQMRRAFRRKFGAPPASFRSFPKQKETGAE